MFLWPEPGSGWIPTHVQVTILQARGLQAEGKHGTSNVYTVFQVGREKYCTTVVEKTPGSPEWNEMCYFELSPGALDRGDNIELRLTVMHQGHNLDHFLGHVIIPLQNMFQEGHSQRNQWYKLHSKSGKKEKERGEIQVSIQFTRNNLTTSVFPLSMKNEAPSPHGSRSQPLAFSTPPLASAPNPKPSTFPSPINLLTTSGATTTTNTHTASLSGLHSPVAGGVTTTAPPILPLETQTADNPCTPLKTSPHPVKPISETLSEPTPEKKTHRPAITATLSSGLEMLKSVTGGQSGTTKKQERLKDPCLKDQAAKYCHLTKDELTQMLLQREAELSRKENHVRELEDYIDKLLVRVMEQAPALLQAPLETKE